MKRANHHSYLFRTLSLILILIICSPVTAFAADVGQNGGKTILHIFSANSELAREEQFTKELRDSFKDDDSIEWYSLALNTKRYSIDPNRLTSYAELLRQDCASRNIAVIVVSGDDALEFLKEQYVLLFENVPVIFYGIGEDWEAKISGYEPYFTGVVDQLSAHETVLEATRLFPGTNNLYVVNDYTTEGVNYAVATHKQLKPLENSIHIEYSEDAGREAILKRMRELPEDSIVLISLYFRDANGQYYSQREMARVLESNCDVPVFAIYSTNMVYGALGGKSADYEMHGKLVAGILARLLNGENTDAIPVITNSDIYNQWVFDKNIMDSMGIGKNPLPAGSRIINETPSIWESYPQLMLGVIFFICASLVIITILVIFSNKLRKKSAALHTAEELLERDNKLREVKERLERIINTAPIAYMLAIDSKVIEINKVMKGYTGFDGDNTLRHLQKTDRTFGLGCVGEQAVCFGVLACPAYRNNTCIKINVLPFQPEQLPTSKAAIYRQRTEYAPLVRRIFQKLKELLCFFQRITIALHLLYCR